MNGSRGPYAKGVAKRAEILRAALAVIARHGYRKTSTRELAAAAGLSEAGMLHYFGSKEKLFEEVLRARDEADQARITASGGGAGDSIDGLRAVVRHNGTVPGLVQLYSTFSAEAGDPEHSSHEFFVDRYARLRASLANAVRTRQSAGTFTPDADPDTIATLLIALSDGLQVQSQYALPADPANLFTHLLNLLSTPKRDS
ncbi:TetR/AcrR family transcriptional regulator [Kribbella sp. NPDC048928]|uniref:TetR/AcrR family transcriptional regulator n=1 Tax=Kribbella sp. NPDC048928 TaxID=3364111 RepID=UPI00370FA20A